MSDDSSQGLSPTAACVDSGPGLGNQAIRWSTASGSAFGPGFQGPSAGLRAGPFHGGPDSCAYSRQARCSLLDRGTAAGLRTVASFTTWRQFSGLVRFEYGLHCLLVKRQGSGGFFLYKKCFYVLT